MHPVPFTTCKQKKRLWHVANYCLSCTVLFMRLKHEIISEVSNLQYHPLCKLWTGYSIICFQTNYWRYCTFFKVNFMFSFHCRFELCSFGGGHKEHKKIDKKGITSKCEEKTHNETWNKKKEIQLLLHKISNHCFHSNC